MIEGPVDVEIFGLTGAIGIAVVAGVISAVLWLAVMVLVSRFLRHGMVHAVVVMMTCITFVALDLVLAAIVWLRPDREAIRLSIAFVFGLQLVSAVGALAFVRQLHKRYPKR